MDDCNCYIPTRSFQLSGKGSRFLHSNKAFPTLWERFTFFENLPPFQYLLPPSSKLLSPKPTVMKKTLLIFYLQEIICISLVSFQSWSWSIKTRPRSVWYGSVWKKIIRFQLPLEFSFAFIPNCFHVTRWCRIDQIYFFIRLIEIPTTIKTLLMIQFPFTWEWPSREIRNTALLYKTEFSY